MNRIELLKKVREIYAEAESLKIKPENEKPKRENKTIPKMDQTGVKVGKVQDRCKWSNLEFSASRRVFSPSPGFVEDEKSCIEGETP